MCVNKEELYFFNYSSEETHLLQIFQRLSGLLASHTINGRAYWLPSAVLVLRGLSQNGGSTVAELSKLGLSNRTLYRTLDRLEDLSLIEREGVTIHNENGRCGKPAAIWRVKSP